VTEGTESNPPLAAAVPPGNPMRQPKTPFRARFPHATLLGRLASIRATRTAARYSVLELLDEKWRGQKAL